MTKRIWSVSALWLTVGWVWLLICWWQGYPADYAVLGTLFCIVFARLGFLAGKHGVYR